MAAMNQEVPFKKIPESGRRIFKISARAGIRQTNNASLKVPDGAKSKN
jgi:hypothetical protein